MTNNIIWFNIGQKGDHYVTWQCAIIEDNFDPKTIKFEDWVLDKDGNPQQVWVPKEEISCPLHKSVEKSFENLDKVVEWIKQNYETGESVYAGYGNWTHIYDVFDPDTTNEFGVALPVKWAGSY